MAEHHSLPRKPLPTHNMDWETSKPPASQHSHFSRFFSRRTNPTTTNTTAPSFLDRILPPHKRYIRNRLSRRALLVLILASLLILIALIIGLALGLRKHGQEALPLPGSGLTSTGDLTYYDPGLGACGATSSSNESVVAVSHKLFDAAAAGGKNPNANPLCGKVIRISREGTSESVDVTVRDRCTGCAVPDLDVTESVFDRLAKREEGRVKCTWVWV